MRIVRYMASRAFSPRPKREIGPQWSLDPGVPDSTFDEYGPVYIEIINRRVIHKYEEMPGGQTRATVLSPPGGASWVG